MNLIEYAKQYLTFTEKTGAHWALCPFHSETTPSFNISNNKYYCFGCKEGGGLISFIMHYHNISYSNALKSLGQNAIKSKSILYVLHDWFKQSITYQEIYYLQSRSLTIDDIYKYEIGYVNSSISQFLLDTGYSIDEILQTGLVKQEYGRLIDLFNNRVIFPIYDNNILVSFSGRSDKKPKYINGYETNIFKKSFVLHGYDIPKSKYTVIVEGYTDVIALSKIGIRSYATMGSLSIHQLKKIWKYDSDPIICLDGDEAGYKGTIHIIKHALPYINKKYRSLRICTIKDDPDYLINNGEKELLLYHIRNAKNIYDYIREKNLYSELNIQKQVTTNHRKLYVNKHLGGDLIIAILSQYKDLMDKYEEDLANISFRTSNTIKSLDDNNININILKSYHIDDQDNAESIIKDMIEYHTQKQYRQHIIGKLRENFSDNIWCEISNTN